MTDAVERVARAIYRDKCNRHYGIAFERDEWENAHEWQRNEALNAARAAIAALRARDAQCARSNGDVASPPVSDDCDDYLALKLLSERERMLGFSGYADWLDSGCPTSADHEYPRERLDDIRFYIKRARTLKARSNGDAQ